MDSFFKRIWRQLRSDSPDSPITPAPTPPPAAPPTPPAVAPALPPPVAGAPSAPPPAGGNPARDYGPDYQLLMADLYQRRDSYEYMGPSGDVRLDYWRGTVAYSGQVREQCLRWLIEHFQPGDENRILLRLEDWVPVIQQLAKDWVSAHFAELTWEQVKAQQELLLFLARRERLRGDPIMDVIAAGLRQLLDHLDETQFPGCSVAFRRHLYGLFLPGHDRLQTWAQRDPDPGCRALLLRLVPAAALASGDLLALRHDKFALVRRQYWTTRLNGGEVPAAAELQELAVDRLRALRHLAQFHLARDYGLDVRAWYKVLPGEDMYYLADYAAVEDVPVLLQGIRTERPRIQLLCLAALIRLEPQHLRALDIGQLMTRGKRYRALLTPHVSGICTLEQIIALRPAFEQDTPAALHAYLGLLARKSQWEFVAAALELLTQSAAPEHVAYIRQVLAVQNAGLAPLADPLRRRIMHSLIALATPNDSDLKSLLTLVAFMVRQASPKSTP